MYQVADGRRALFVLCNPPHNEEALVNLLVDEKRCLLLCIYGKYFERTVEAVDLVGDSFQVHFVLGATMNCLEDNIQKPFCKQKA
ncbi:Plasma membrane fusion protein PRM1 [Frankliniella fusca]|uniref:Plasma membrane fusion protein PRM1 n=1 Tax=Frankliniella fusca TaxID=407009 RepID=A0AAE1HJK8_9NEOP|nr:Plasma membrane fusion protein PRM1 [Frankliniella fusca]